MVGNAVANNPAYCNVFDLILATDFNVLACYEDPQHFCMLSPFSCMAKV